jgi:hypothetical protein
MATEIPQMRQVEAAPAELNEQAYFGGFQNDSHDCPRVRRSGFSEHCGVGL